MSPRLMALIEKARHVQMSPRDLEEHRISFAYGNANYEDTRVTREEVIRASRLLSGGHETSTLVKSYES